MANNHSHHRGSCLYQAQVSTSIKAPAIYCPGTNLPTIKAHDVYCTLATTQRGVLCDVFCAHCHKIVACSFHLFLLLINSALEQWSDFAHLSLRKNKSTTVRQQVPDRSVYPDFTQNGAERHSINVYLGYTPNSGFIPGRE